MERDLLTRRKLLTLVGIGLPGLVVVACAQRPETQKQADKPTAVPAPANFIPKKEVAPQYSIPTAVVKDLPVIALQIKDFSFSVSPGEVGVNFCTEGRPVGTTLRVSVYKELIPPDKNIDPNTLDKNNWEIIKELGVPCFDTNPTNSDRPVWRTQSLPTGRYIFRGEARPNEARGDWNHLSVKVVYASFVLREP